MPATILTKQDFTLGAIYRLASKRGIGRDGLVALLTSRAGVAEKAAKHLAGHWLTTGPFRVAAAKATA